MQPTTQPLTLTAFLGAFSPDPSETIYLRAFAPKGHNLPVQKMTATRNALIYDPSLQQRLLDLNQTLGLYFVVNSGGDSDADIVRFNAFFCENDKLSLAEQHAALDASPLPPSIRVETKKSVHAYWLIEGDCSEDEWREGQARLIAYFAADSANKNPSRVMRLPFFEHIATDLSRKRVATHTFEPDRSYDVVAMMQAFPAVQPSQAKTKKQPQSQSQQNGGYANWDALRAALGRAIENHPTANKNKHGKIDCQGICHGGQGPTGLFYDPFDNQAHCNSGCDQEVILQAFGLPTQPSNQGPKTTATSVPIWPPPQSLPDGLKPVPELPAHILPEVLRAWLSDISERMQIPLDFPAAAAIVLLASLIGSQFRIRPKKQDDWQVTPNLWGALVGRPSTMKSPVISEVFKPLRRLEAAARKEFAEELEAYEDKLEKAEIKRIANREEMKKAAKNKKSLDDWKIKREVIEKPTERRYIVNDSSVEKYGELLRESPNGLLLFRDELTGWLRSLDDERKASDRAFYLEAWNGSGRFTYDRIGRGTLHIDDTTTSVFGGIQPGPLAVYLRAALAFGGDDGLLQRIQVLVYPDEPKTWKNVDRWPETEAKNKAFDLFQRLSGLDTEPFSKDDNGKPYLHFDDSAQDFFDDWLTDLMNTLRNGRITHPILESHFAKYRKLMPALALIFYLCEADDGFSFVSLSAAKKAAAFCSYLWAHAERIYGLAIGADALAARALARRLQADDLTDGFTARDVQQKGWSGLTTVEDVRCATETLSLFDWLHPEAVKNSSGGRPTVTYLINPGIKGVSL